jgi:hypothetical protein
VKIHNGFLILFRFAKQKVANAYAAYVTGTIKNSQYNELVRKKQFNEVDFLSFIGGLLGLFAGFSSLSFVEILYWMLKKIISSFRTKKIHPIIIVSHGEIENNALNQKQENVMLQYFNDSSIHGVNYLSNTNIFEL